MIALALLGAILLDFFRFGGAILPEVIGMAGAPFTRTLAADFKVLGIGGELAFPVAGPALALADHSGAGELLGVKPRRFKWVVAETAKP